MDDRIRSVAVAAGAVLAVSLVAATIESTVTPDASGSPGPAGPGEGVSPPTGPDVTPGEALQIPFLQEIVSVLAVLVLLAVLVYAIKYWRRTVAAIALFVVGVAIVALLLTLLDPSLPPLDRPAMDQSNTSLPCRGDAGQSGHANRPSLPTVLLLFVLAAVLVGTLIPAVPRSPSETDDDTATTPRQEPDVDPAAVGDAAGRAADRLEDEAAVDNEVFRAWREMTTLLDVRNPEASTPAEFASAAVEAGLDRDDVDELTRLFEDVRYGEYDASAERERRAITIFRRIEDRYAEDEG
jgi:hypothetical protein